MRLNDSKNNIRHYLNEKFRNEASSDPGKIGPSELDELWDLSGKALNSHSFSDKVGWQRFAAEHGLTPSRHRYTKPVVIGLIALLVITGLLFYFASRNERSGSEHAIIAQMQFKYSESLPDGSTIYFNNQQEFTASEGFTSLDRKVNLTGNAYCKITPDEDHPFLIQTPIGLISVLGTEFLVIQDKHSLSVEVKEGKVLLRHLEKHDLEVVLLAGQRGDLHFDKSMILTRAGKEDAPQELIMMDASVKDALELASAVAPDKLSIQTESIDPKCPITSLWNLMDPNDIKAELELLFNASITDSGTQLFIKDLNCSN